MVEMLMQSEVGQIRLLPALPNAWAQGEVRGLHARGGFVVDMRWAKGKLVEASVRSLRGGDCVVRYGERQVSLSTKVGRTYRLQPRDFL
jgi:alpha-L-fucosidase 2